MPKIDQVSVNGTTYEIVPEIAPLFSESTSYVAGDYVIKDAVLYRFMSAHAAGAWVGTDAEVITVGDELTGLKADLSQTDETIFNGYTNNPPVANGSFNVIGVYMTNNKRLRTNFIPVKTGDRIVIDNGSLKHACGAWEGTLSEATNIRNDSSFKTNDEEIISPVNGYYIVVFAKQDATQEIALSDFDGSVLVYANGMYRNAEYIKVLKSEINKVVCENLMGNEASVLYPVNIPAGGYFTVSTSDGSVFPTDSTLEVQLLKENKTQTDYFTLKNGATSRTIHTSTSQPETRYLRFNQTPTVPLMVNMGQSALPYQQYFPDIQKNVEQNTEDIEEINKTVPGLLEGEKIVDILAVQNSVKVSRPRIINGSLSTTTGKRDYTLSRVNSYCITPDLLHVAKGSVITKSAQTTMRIYEYSKDDAFISYSTVATGTTKYTFSADKYVRLFFLVSGSSTNAKTIFDNVVFDLILLNYEKPDIISTFMGLSGNGGTFEQYVESGEACIIQFPNSEVMEIDFHKDALSNNYRYYRDSLALRGVRRIDYIVITHYHDDHIGLFAKALEYGYIKIDGAKAYLPQYITNELAEARGWETYKERQDTIIQTLQEHDCTIVYPVDGDVLKIDDAVITWYNCDHSIYSDTTGDYYSTNYNDWSLCFNFRYENTIVNYSSDLGPIGQMAMAGKMPKASVLKAMHHGWDNGKNALVPAFINNVSPDMVVSCNGYEHRPTVDNQQEPNMLNASSPIYSWAEANGVPAYPTCTNGNIDILINKYGYRLDGHYTRFIRNDKNWSWSDNSEHVEP